MEKAGLAGGELVSHRRKEHGVRYLKDAQGVALLARRR